MTPEEHWNALCDLEDFFPGVDRYTEAYSLTTHLSDEWHYLEQGWYAVASYALARQAECAQERDRLKADK